MQKRIVLVLLVLLAASMSVFAMDQASVAARLPYFEFNSNQSQTTMIVGGANNTLFAGIDGSALTDDEIMMVEGEGVAGAVGGFVVGWIVGVCEWGTLHTAKILLGQKPEVSVTDMWQSALTNACFGAVAGFFSPTP